MKVRLTNSAIEKAKPKPKPYELRDTKLVGLLVRVQPTGRKTFYCEFKKGARVKLGVHPSLSCKDANTKALKVFSTFHLGQDPRRAKPETAKVEKFGNFLQLHYFPWVEANHKNPLDTKNRLLAECGHFSKLHFSDITPFVVEKWRLEKVANGNSPHTANKCFAYLRAALSKADEWDIFSPNPIAKMKKIKTAKSSRIRYLSEAEEVRLRQTLKVRDSAKGPSSPNAYPFRDHLFPMIILSLNTGMRRGELFSLKWEHVNFETKQISITAQNAKSRKVRHIPLNTEALEVCRQLYNSNISSAMFVFRKSDGKPFKDAKGSWATLMREANIQNFRWHDMRHHFASRLAIEGVNLNTIRELLGHSSYEMTLRYAHLSADHKAEAVNRIIQRTPK